MSKPNINSFAEAEAFFASHVVKSRTYAGSVKVVRLENNTILRKTYDHGTQAYGYAVRLHNTDVVTFWPDRTDLYSGGWNSATTADRMHRYSPAGIRVSHRWSGDDPRIIVTSDTDGEVGTLRSSADNVTV